MVGKYNGPDVGFVKNLKSRADKYRNFDESAAYARKASIKKLPLQTDPNVLHKFASYNTIFTLSALSTREIRNPQLFFMNSVEALPNASRNAVLFIIVALVSSVN